MKTSFFALLVAFMLVASMLCGYESIVNKVVGKITSMTVVVDGEEINVLADAVLIGGRKKMFFDP